MPKIRNIIIFVAIAAVLVLAYVFFIKPSFNSQPNLVSSSDTTATNTTTSGGATNASVVDGASVAQNFLSLLLSVQTIKLNVSIFTDPAFESLHDSSVTLIPDATIGRPDPFAQFGAGDTVSAPTTTTTTAPTTTNSTPAISIPTTPKSTGH